MVSFVTGAYILAALLFILALAGLSKHETARRGNAFGMAGMALAIVATLLLVLDYLTDDLIVDKTPIVVGLVIILVAGTVGAVIGIRLARGVEMTGMPELIAMMHSFVGLAAVLVGYNTFIEVASAHGNVGLESDAVHNAEVFVGVFIGAVTFTGSIVANLKLSARMRSAPHRAARAPPAQPGHPRGVGRAAGVVHAHGRLGRHGAAGGHDRPRAGARLPPRRRDRRRRHARRRVDAQQLLRLGGGRRGLHAGQRPADHHRRARRLVGCDPQLHHVQGDEPLVRERHRRRLRLRRRRRPARPATTASTARSRPTTWPTCSPTRPRS